MDLQIITETAKSWGLNPKEVERMVETLSKSPGMAEVPEEIILNVIVKTLLQARIRKWVFFFPKKIEGLAGKIRLATSKFVPTKVGQLFLGLSLLSPLTFIPTVWQSWTAENIAGLKTITWPLLLLANIALLIIVCQKDGWVVQFNTMLWILFVFLVWLATLIR